MSKLSTWRPFFKNAWLSARGPFFFYKCPDLVCDNHFSALDVAISMIQQHFIKSILNVSKYNCILVAQICTIIRFSKYFIYIFLLNKRSKHKFWTLISRSQEARLWGWASVSRVLCGAFYLNCGCLHTAVCSRNHLGKLCVGLTLIAWFVFAPVCRKTVTSMRKPESSNKICTNSKG